MRPSRLGRSSTQRYKQGIKINDCYWSRNNIIGEYYNSFQSRERWYWDCMLRLLNCFLGLRYIRGKLTKQPTPDAVKTSPNTQNSSIIVHQNYMCQNEVLMHNKWRNCTTTTTTTRYTNTAYVLAPSYKNQQHAQTQRWHCERSGQTRYDNNHAQNTKLHACISTPACTIEAALNLTGRGSEVSLMWSHVRSFLHTLST